MILHIIPKTGFTNGQVAFLDEEFGNAYQFDHWVYGPPWKGYEEGASSERVHLAESLGHLFCTTEFLSRLREADAILVDWVDFRLLLLLAPFISKTTLCFWGGELYQLRTYRQYGAVRRTALRCCLAVVSRARTILTLTEREYQRLQDVARLRGTHALGSVASTKENALVKEFESAKTHRRILVGNSATPTNRHREALELLSRFRNEDIEVYVPLSYGNEAYRRQILICGEELLGNAFRPLTEYMPKETYLKFLSTIDVAVFNHGRQQALGNIYQLLATGAKLYLADDGDTLPHLATFGFHVFPVSDLRQCSRTELFACSPTDISVNRELCSEEQFHRRNIEIWSAALRTMEAAYGR